MEMMSDSDCKERKSDEIRNEERDERGRRL